MGMTAVRIRVMVFKDCFLYLQEDSFMDLQLVLSHRVPPRDLAVLLCNKSNAFYNLGKWNEAFVAAKECLQWDPTYVKVWCKGPLGAAAASFLLACLLPSLLKWECFSFNSLCT